MHFGRLQADTGVMYGEVNNGIKKLKRGYIISVVFRGESFVIKTLSCVNDTECYAD